jgi:pyruvate/2-oxoglutarate dehydrogenase complex dihydrolipoamide dehydrogenase (E3) component
MAEVKRAAEFGIMGVGQPKIDFPKVMLRLRTLRAKIAPADGHEGTTGAGAHVYQGRGRFTTPSTIEVNGKTLKFRKAVIASGGRPTVPNVPGLKEAPYTTNEVLFNLIELPPRMVILGAGVIALEMAQSFALFGTSVTVIQRSSRLFESKQGDAEAAKLLQEALEEDGVKFVTGTTEKVETLRRSDTSESSLPLMKVFVKCGDETLDMECECLLVATGRASNVEDLGLEAANVEYELVKGVKVNDLAQSSNPNVYAIGDACAGVPRLTHMSGEMAKQAVQNALFNGNWKLSDFVVPAVAYTHPEYATVGITSEEMAAKKGIEVDVYRSGLEHNDRAILESDKRGVVKVVCGKGTDKILGATIVAGRAGEMINEVTLAMRHGIGLSGIGRNIHSYPTTGEALMGCGLQFINARWEQLVSTKLP